jgi:hypothetical protein
VRAFLIASAAGGISPAGRGILACNEIVIRERIASVRCVREQLISCAVESRTAALLLRCPLRLSPA